ncbi:lactoylglutathione lyase [Xanthomonas citri]|uniref:lactoylglutathione lyase n=1 Tax=Xanthomonas citri TaxID=346 RepID=UPI001E403356|nr:lactoylglutathione lyase [Xanthomonas citri]MCC4627590.1 lactoylglutathione lyase [Xanthomonas citri]
MLHHVSLGVRAIDASATFYDAALGALGDVRVWSDLEPGTRDQAVGYGGPGGEGCLALERVMSVEVSAKRPVARRDKACALPGLAAWARRATGHFPEGWPSAARSTRHAACLGASHAGATQHPLRTADGQRISSQRT